MFLLRPYSDIRPYYHRVAYQWMLNFIKLKNKKNNINESALMIIWGMDFCCVKFVWKVNFCEVKIFYLCEPRIFLSQEFLKNPPPNIIKFRLIDITHTHTHTHTHARVCACTKIGACLSNKYIYLLIMLRTI